MNKQNSAGVFCLGWAGVKLALLMVGTQDKLCRIWPIKGRSLSSPSQPTALLNPFRKCPRLIHKAGEQEGKGSSTPTLVHPLQRVPAGTTFAILQKEMELIGGFSIMSCGCPLIVALIFYCQLVFPLQIWYGLVHDYVNHLDGACCLKRLYITIWNK